MWQNWLSGILGLWIILIVFLGFSSTLNAVLLVIAGLVIAICGFWTASTVKTAPKNSESEISPASTPNRSELAAPTAGTASPAGGPPPQDDVS